MSWLIVPVVVRLKVGVWSYCGCGLNCIFICMFTTLNFMSALHCKSRWLAIDIGYDLYSYECNA